MLSSKNDRSLILLTEALGCEKKSHFSACNNTVQISLLFNNCTLLNCNILDKYELFRK